jgi:hypothetical protein
MLWGKGRDLSLVNLDIPWGVIQILFWGFFFFEGGQGFLF